MSQSKSEASVDLRRVVREIEFLVRRVLPKSISVRTELPANLRPISGDADQISQMLLNLCINARDAMPTGGVLTISAENPPFERSTRSSFRGRKGRYVRLTVTDTGIGIPPAAIDRVFSPTFTTKEPAVERGAGLATVLDIVRRHQGMIRAVSIPDGGTEIEIFLPTIFPNTQYPNPPASADSLKPTLLIAEADAHLLRAYGLICHSRGFNIQTCTSGVECLNRLAAYTPDALVLDLDIPWGGGDGVLACLRDEFGDAIQTVVFVTGFDSTAAVAQRSGLPASNCFAKPLRPTTLIESVRKMLVVDPPVSGEKSFNAAAIAN